MTRSGLIERRVVRTAALAALGLTRGDGFALAPAPGADHPGGRQLLLQVAPGAGRTGSGPVRRHERFELTAASAAGVFEQGHGRSLSQTVPCASAHPALPTATMAGRRTSSPMR